MKVYEAANLRNVALMGHGHTGKTQLLSSLLYAAGTGNRLGLVDDGTSVTDFDEEEIQRKFSIAAGLAYAEWGKSKINFLDTPGYNLFFHEAESALPVVDGVLLLVHAVSGVEVQTERAWKACEKLGLPCALVLNQMDRDRASLDRTLESLQSAFGRGVIPVHLPWGTEKNFHGVIDLIRMKAYDYADGDKGRAKEGAIPADLEEAANKGHEALIEMVAEGDDQLMEKFFDQGTLSPEDSREGLQKAFRERRLFPVLCSSALKNLGTENVLNFLVDYFPAPSETEEVEGTLPDSGETVKRKRSGAAPTAVYVFKTVADAFAGRISYFRVFSGSVKNDAHLQNYPRSSTERFAHISVVQGKTLTNVAELQAGDIGAVAKLKGTLTGDTLGEKSAPFLFPMPKLTEPAISFAIEPKTRADEDRLSTAIHRMTEEDRMLRFSRDPQTKEFLISGAGQQHVEVAVSKLKRRYNVEVTLKAPKVPYRETIRGKAEAQGKYKRQTGGHGQYGDCKIRMEPMPRGGSFEFVNDIFGGSIPKNYIPAVEKGIRDAAEKGFLAGFPVVDFKVSLYDGSYHDVDSSDLAFQIAGSFAFKKCMEQAKPCLLEPVMRVEITVPDNFSGDIMGNLNSRRGRIQGMDPRGGSSVITAHVPLAEMLTYASDLTSMTQGRGNYTMEFDYYDVVPQMIADKIKAAAHVADAEKDKGGEA